jgi:malate synthase A
MFSKIVRKNISLRTPPLRNVSVLSKSSGRDYLFTPGALSFLDTVSSKHSESHRKLLSDRKNNTVVSEFRDDTKWIREDREWTGPSIPQDLQTRHVEITGPTSNTKMFINALNSQADCYMTDIEDSLSPSWENIQDAHHNIYQAVRGELSYSSNGKEYQINSETPTLLVRTRGLHMNESNIVDDNGVPVPAMLVDLGLHMYHNAEILSSGESATQGGVYFYIPKIETYEEAKYINGLFNDLQQMTGLPIGTIRATFLIETFPAIFQTEEIIHALRDHISGLNCGRWDYIFSFIKENLDNPRTILPDRDLLTMDTKFLKAYVQQIVKSCHNRNIHAMGGMSALIPGKDESENKKILEKVLKDKKIEISEGCDGAWVAHPHLIDPIKNLFVSSLQNQSNQIESDVNKDTKISSESLKNISELIRYVNYSETNIRNNLSVSLQYLYEWLNGNGAASINGVMEDMATCEISLFQIKQWLHHKIFYKEAVSYKRLSKELFLEILDQEYSCLSFKMNIEDNKMTSAKEILKNYVLDLESKFLVEKADEYLHLRHNFQGIRISQPELNRLSGTRSLSGLDLTKHRGDYLNDFMFNSTEEHPYYQFLGTTTGISAVNVVAGGQGKIGPYVGGWQINAMSNRLEDTLPDTLHVAPEEPGNSAVELNNHLESADKIQWLNQLNGNQTKNVDYYDLAMLADLEQGWSNPEKVRQSVKNSIRNGINLIHIEDQGIYKRCGHLGDKELAPLHEYKMILKAANYAAQELMGPEQSVHQWVRFVARTDALSAKRIMFSTQLKDENHPDHKFIDWSRGFAEDGKYLYLKEGINPETGNPWGLDLSITRCTEVVKDGLASHVWMETPDADLHVAKIFLETVNKNLEIYDKKAYGLYNHSPSFDWDVKFYEEAVPLSEKLIKFVSENIYGQQRSLEESVSMIQNWLSLFGEHVQGDHCFDNLAVTKILYAINDHLNGSNTQSVISQLENSHSGNLDSHYLDSCLDLLKNNQKSPVETICDEIVSQRLKNFEPMLASFGFNTHLVTLPEYHVIAYNMYELANDFKDNGIYSYVNQVQRPERIRYENSHNYTFYKHQTATGTGLEAEFNSQVGSANSKILSGSTESDDDTKRNILVK